LFTGVADETNLGCADTVIDARFSCDLCSLVGYCFFSRCYVVFDFSSRGLPQNSRTAKEREERPQATYFRQTSSLKDLGDEGGSGELLLQ
jgi:hypothetical protein